MQNQNLVDEVNPFPNPTKEIVPLDYMYLIFEYKTKTTKTGRVRMAINVDIKLSCIPMFIMDPATRDFGFNFFKNMVKICKNF